MESTIRALPTLPVRENILETSRHADFVYVKCFEDMSEIIFQTIFAALISRQLETICGSYKNQVTIGTSLGDKDMATSAYRGCQAEHTANVE
ncbi:hypothetical protein SprV_0802601500 [Sparganum proliferum]